MRTSSITKSGLFLAFVLFTAPMFAQQYGNIDYFRRYDKTGINVFETTKESTMPYNGFSLRISGGFTTQFQSIQHSNTADVSLKDNTLTSTTGDSVNVNALYPLVGGFNLPTANLIISAQLADGIYVNLENYMSARHHNEFWVKGGYIQIDKLPMFGSPQWFTDNFTIRIGQMENNYGDAHFYRTDNANGILNPFVGENIMDAFATEMGGEFYYKPSNGIIAMLGVSNGLLNSAMNQFVTVAGDSVGRKPSIYGKLGYDKQLNDDLRVRLTGSVYMNGGTSRNTLYGGDRAGSRYYWVGEGTYYMAPALTATTATNKAFSGRLDPGFSTNVTAIMINPFIKFQGLEVFATYEMASGSASLTSTTDTVDRDFNQLAVSALYRFLKDEQAYIGVRYNTVSGQLAGYTADEPDVTVSRYQIAAGWFPTENLLLKLEYVNQDYTDFKTSDIRNGLNFNGVVVEACVGF